MAVDIKLAGQIHCPTTPYSLFPRLLWAGRAQLLFLFDEPCLATVERRRLTGKLPSLKHPGQVPCCAGESSPR